MPSRQIIVDGSNLATEGRSLPSLTQLDQAVREYLAENPADVVTVVVDASFGHRIAPSEVSMFEEAEAAGELVSPPAGAIGRGDAFLLRIAEKTGATVLSNDSFQEFHGEHPWLFDDGRLVGGKPVPGVGWIFLPRAPVRGQRSRDVVKEAKRRKRADEAAETTTRESGLDLAASRAKGRAKKVDRAIARATEEAVEPKAKGRRRRRAAGVPPAEAVNEPLAFITFIAAHPLGSEVVGTVLEFSSHGAFVNANGARCYLPLSAMGDPPPRRAREVLAKGEERAFVIQALDPQRRGVELALPGYARVAGGPTEETVEAEIHPRAEAAPKHRRRDKADAAATDGGAPVDVAPPIPVAVDGPAVAEPSTAPGPDAGSAPPARRAGGRKAALATPATGNARAEGADTSPGAPVAVKKAAPRRVAAVKKAPIVKAATPARKAAPKEEAPVAGPSKAAGAKRAPAKKATSGETGTAVAAIPARATPVRATPARATAAKATPVKKTPAKRPPAKAATGEPSGPSAGEAPAPTTPAKRPRVRATSGEAPTETSIGEAPAQATRTRRAPAKATAGEAPAKVGPAKAPPTKASPTKASPTKATPARKAGATRKAAPGENPAATEVAAPSASGHRPTTRARRRTTKAPDRPAEPEL
jgi:hypothetical protein